MKDQRHRRQAGIVFAALTAVLVAGTLSGCGTLIGVVAGSAIASGPPAYRAVPADRVAEVRRSTPIRLALTDGTRVEGRFLGVADSTATGFSDARGVWRGAGATGEAGRALLVDRGADTVAVSTTAVREVATVRPRHSVRNGFLIGVAADLVLLGFVAWQAMGSLN